MSDPYSLTPDAPLQAHTTFRVAATAKWLAELRDATALPQLFAHPELKGLPLLALGQGSNMLFTRDFDGLVLKLANRGIQPLDGEGLLRVGAGEDWDAFVRWSLAQGYRGLENLILIPGTVGAAPIQNIGAYGAEVREFIAAVHAWDRERQGFVELDNAACAFGYRDSVFKQQPQRYLITAVDFRLPREHALKLDYAGICEQLALQGVREPDAPAVALAVETLRRRKLPDPKFIGNAGSFFKNPVITDDRAAALQRAYPKLPTYHSADGHTKISAAWLIEACGFKGVRDGDAGVSDKHSLVLVNYGQASGTQIWSLAGRIRDSVAVRFGITLETEPLIV